ncbi:MAG: class I SAM-dependent methyltransferase, partial [Actinomycetes bacterium]
MDDDPLPITGERTVPGVTEENYWFRRHEAVYLALRDRCAGARVLEAGCGEGYGADLLAGVASTVLALDHDPATVGHVARRYPHVGVARANLVALPVRDGGGDVVVSLQVVEHLWEQERFLRECVRALRPGGSLLLSTPNRLTFSPGRDTPLNPFHTRELNAAELTELLHDAGFTVESMLGVFHGAGLAELDARHGGSIIEAQVQRAVADAPWPEQLLADVAAVSIDDFDLTSADERNIDDSLDLVA